ncbi:MAG TPA: DEAD/DEAH box helicase [Thermoplasmata archaeon]|nr:DEAD/DEAH box helicase [Thermoplasmata archaeon]
MPRGRARDRPAVPAAPVPTQGVPLADTPIDAATRAVLERDGIASLYPPQAAALGPVLAGRSVLLACPTASGKSLVAYLALLRAARARRTGLYLVPLRALASEKAEELERFAELGISVGISIGDYDLPAERLEKLDVLVATSEKADGLLRRGSPWLDRLGVVVADEVHLMRDPDRGPTLEVSLTRLRRAYPDLQIVALSATVGNSEEVAAWLDAVHVASDFRPVPLKQGVYYDGRITFTDLSSREVPPPGEPVPRLVRTALADGGQALVFVNSRRASEQLAQQLTATVRASLSPDERARAAAAAEELASGADEETEGIRKLRALLPHGVAYHNASLTNPERRVVERAFRERTLKALVATPTLAAGINLPARRVIVRDTSRYDDRLGMQAPIPALEVQQMLGRAGRPRFDPYGEALLVARAPDDEDRLLDGYLSVEPEPIVSRLASEPALRMHVLALVASGAIADERALESFFGATFYGRTLPLPELHATVRTVRRFLEKNDLLAAGPGLAATRFGALTSELYLDPLSAIVLRDALGKAPLGVSPFALLAAVAATPDLAPLFLRRGEEADLLTRFGDEHEELLVKPEEPPLELDLDGFLATLKTATVLETWIAETPIVEITARHNIEAGDLRGRVEDADWLLFCAGRLAMTYQRRLGRAIDDLALRVRYGVKEELLDLVRLRGVGRVRARQLYQAGFADREALRNAPIDRIEQALRSPRLAEMVVGQLNPRGTRPSRSPTTAPPPALPPPAPARKRRTLEEFPAEPEP